MPLEVVHPSPGDDAAPLIVATAAVNGLGSNPHQSWAFRRAELTEFAEAPFRCANGARATMAHVRTLPPRLAGAARMAALADLALAQLAPAVDALAIARGGTLPVLLALPERMGPEGGAAFRGERAGLERALTDALARRGAAAAVGGDPRGAAAFAFVLQRAVALLAAGAGAVLAGGVDTYYDARVMQALIDAGRLYDGENTDVLIPGEGAAFVLLARASAARRARLPALARVAAAATNAEPGTMGNDVTCLGLGLSRAAVAALEPLRRARGTLDWWLSDVTAESYRVQEFQLAWPRAAAGLMPPQSTVEFLPTAFGDLGAATMPTGVVLAVEGFLRGDPNAATCLVTGSSTGDERGVVLVARCDTR